MRNARLQLYRLRKSGVASAVTTGYAAITVRLVTWVPSAGIILEAAALFVGRTIISENGIDAAISAAVAMRFSQTHPKAADQSRRTAICWTARFCVGLINSQNHSN
jgi:hypothetical protein